MSVSITVTALVTSKTELRTLCLNHNFVATIFLAVMASKYQAVDNPALANYVLISSDQDFSNALHLAASKHDDYHVEEELPW
ncbi:hypothetical protein VNO78_12383 [Psophocarpus tetragonolobus]|uniref:Uncharacterized protein n=1 Tax=Psophocarpus tetragonolobus TaxID=3891 RepID=A0AAN9SNV4_PSOTE